MFVLFKYNFKKFNALKENYDFYFLTNYILFVAINKISIDIYSNIAKVYIRK